MQHGHNLVHIYADEGISGTKTKNRKEFQRMMADARRGSFEIVVVKDAYVKHRLKNSENA